MERKPKILVTMPSTMTYFVTPEVKSLLNSFADVEYNEKGTQFTKAELAEKIMDKDYALTGWGTPAFDEQMLKNAPDFKMVAHTGGSVGALIDSSVYNTDVLVASGNGYMAKSVAEGTLCYMLMALRRTVKFANGVQHGDWNYGAYDEGLIGKTVGIISLGAISKNLIKMLKPFGVKIFVSSTKHDKKLETDLGFTYATTEQIFKTCKVISVHTASTPATHHMINKDLIQSISDGAVFINTSRGAVVDEAALAEELKTGRFLAVLDVFQKEPLPIDSPLIGLENVILMPHRGGSTIDLYSYTALKLAEDIKSHYEKKTVVNLIPKEAALKMTTLL